MKKYGLIFSLAYLFLVFIVMTPMIIGEGISGPSFAFTYLLSAPLSPIIFAIIDRLMPTAEYSSNISMQYNIVMLVFNVCSLINTSLIYYVISHLEEWERRRQ